MKHQKYVLSDVSSCNLRLNSCTYFWYFVMYCTTRYWHILLMFLQYPMKHQKYVPASSGTANEKNVRTMCQYLVVQYMEKHQKFVRVCSCRTNFWCFSMYCTTRYWHIFLMLSSCTVDLDVGTYFWCTVHGETSEICVSI
jgi:hypothetical protein